MQTLDDTIVDFTPPLPKRCVQEYHCHFVYQPVEALCYVDGCPRPLRPKDYWIDKKPLPPSPTLLEPWPSNEDDDAEEEEEHDNKAVGWWSDLKRNTRQGYKETQDLIKQNKALQRVLSHSWYP